MKEVSFSEAINLEPFIKEESIAVSFGTMMTDSFFSLPSSMSLSVMSMPSRFKLLVRGRISKSSLSILLNTKTGLPLTCLKSELRHVDKINVSYHD